ncbi:N-acetylmuramoyl-L-alanine amidase [Leuconostocaceae bacterium ESL0958]|nr:N-acetylmuramoyl-L-alanine amidase [Leuconostocaceae bacterium ESL0958]
MIAWLKENKIGATIVAVILFAIFLLILSLSKQNQFTTRPNDVRLHSAPNRHSRTLTTMKSGTKLLVLARQNGWWRVKNTKNDQVGWVAAWVANNTSLKTASTLSEATFVLDAGHGGSDTGAISIDGKHYEKTYTLATAEKTKKELEKTGARVLMVRDSDVVVPLLYIPRKAEAYQADAQISFHFDSAEQNNAASGISQFYYNANSQTLAQTLNRSLNNLPLQNRGVDTVPYLVIKDVSRPAVLLELGFINSKKDFSYIRQNSYQQKVARDIRQGLSQYIQ